MKHNFSENYYSTQKKKRKDFFSNSDNYYKQKTRKSYDKNNDFKKETDTIKDKIFIIFCSFILILIIMIIYFAFI